MNKQAALKPNRKWLREASLRRLSLLVKDKTEIVDNVLSLQVNLGSVDGLEDSGLSPVVKQHLHRWVDGKPYLLLLLPALFLTKCTNRD